MPWVRRGCDAFAVEARETRCWSSSDHPSALPVALPGPSAVLVAGERREDRLVGWMGSGLLVALPLLALPACKAEVSAQADMNSSASVDVVGSSNPEDNSTNDDRGLSATPDSEPASSGVQTLLGARHDLRLQATVTSASCNCLAVAVGSPTDQAFSWQSEVPAIDPATQLVIALSSAGVSCVAEPEGSLGASYWGYRTSDGDVVVVVEPALFGRPLTGGAIIPRPEPGRRVLVKPLDANTPYGRANDGSPEGCVVFQR